jgi:diguanylate cyclase (GGDEF)-like protein/PAS domain S-box-containing protein
MAGQAVNVLLVEDNQAEAELIQRMLGAARGLEFHLEHVQHLRAAVERIRAGRFDVVLLDLALPDGRGLANFQRISGEAPSTAVIILTNVEDEEAAARAVRDGAQDYLVKRDVDRNLLVHAIRYAIERQRADEALRESEERYALAVNGANDGLWDWRINEGTVYYSPRWRSMLGYHDDDIRGVIDFWFERVHPNDLEDLRATLETHLAGASDHFEFEHRMRMRNGDYLWVVSRGLAVRDNGGNAYRIAGSLTDISARKRAEEQLIHDALHDSLTGLPNRALFLDRLGLALRQFLRDNDKLFAVLFFDVDRFKMVNDSLGHTVGDALLVSIARRLEKFLRPGDTLARLGGDEFAVLLNDVDDVSDATQVAERVGELLRRKFVIHKHEVFTSTSIGIALSTSRYEHPEEILRDADLAMYRAKHTGNASYELFDSDMHETALAALKLETDLRRALERREFRVHYQPIVSVQSGRILGFEALLRWEHPELGLLHPDYFILTAEESGLIAPIGWWALREACFQAQTWQKLFPMDPPLSISVNISGKLFSLSGMADRMFEILKESGLDPRSLRLEITESAMMHHGEAALTELGKLRAKGVQLHIDDFGTGYSSLTYLQRFSYDTLKIDRSFVCNMKERDESSTIVQAIVALGRMLNMNVIAEGVETPEQLQMLREMECPEFQGFWFSRPLERTAVEPLLSA